MFIEGSCEILFAYCCSPAIRSASLCDTFNHKLPPVELHGLAGPCYFDCLLNRGNVGIPMTSRPSHVNLLVEAAMTKYRPESCTSAPSVTIDFRPEVDLSQLVQ